MLVDVCRIGSEDLESVEWKHPSNNSPSYQSCRHRAVVSRVGRTQCVITGDPDMALWNKYMFRRRRLQACRVHADGVTWEADYSFADDSIRIYGRLERNELSSS